MNENTDRLPRDCAEISQDVELKVSAGTEFAGPFPGTVFAYEPVSLNVPPCSRVEVTFENRDDVRHQWMLHGLPRYIYPGGMFHIEANGGESVTGQFIVPSDHHSYLVHCDLAQHMEKGMKAQLIVGEGSGDLWSVPGVSAQLKPDDYIIGALAPWIVLALTLGLAAGLLTARLLRRLNYSKP